MVVVVRKCLKLSFSGKELKKQGKETRLCDIYCLLCSPVHVASWFSDTLYSGLSVCTFCGDLYSIHDKTHSRSFCLASGVGFFMNATYFS